MWQSFSLTKRENAAVNTESLGLYIIKSFKLVSINFSQLYKTTIITLKEYSTKYYFFNTKYSDFRLVGLSLDWYLYGQGHQLQSAWIDHNGFELQPVTANKRCSVYSVYSKQVLLLQYVAKCVTLQAY